ncbi:lamin tail domain-containing protein [Streptomyces sp. NPDC004065]|uniref:lamin tail domain-containing protein n=1 Tax=Streptomyces sp. NPDC004065 TaxID=3364689 RepID=UPI00384FA9B8
MSVSASVTARRLAAAALTAGALVGSVTLPASAADHARPYRPQVEITHVQYDTPGRNDRSNRSLNQQWVELTNTTRRSVNLNGWTLSDREGRTYTFHHYRLNGRATVRVHTGIGRDSHRDLFQDRRHVVWDRRDTATLRNDHGRVIDSVSWGSERRGDRDHRRHADHHNNDHRRH